MDFNENMLVVTIGIQMHGVVISGELDLDTKGKFTNVRMLSKAGKFTHYETCRTFEFSFLSIMNNYFRKNLESSTYDIMSSVKTGVFLGNISFDKLLTTDNDWFQGIYLISVHKGRKLIYPNEPTSNEIINLLDISDLHKLANVFVSEVPRIQDLSTPLPSSKIYIDEEKMVQQDSSISKNDKEKSEFHYKNAIGRL